MNIIQIICNSMVGGAEVHTRLIAKAMARAGHRITLVYGPGPYSAQFASIAGSGVECVELDMRSHPFKSVIFLRRLIKQRKADLIHSHMHNADFLAMAARTGLKVRQITTVHCIPQKVRASIFYRARIMLATFISFHFMYRIFAVSVSAKEQIRRGLFMRADRITVVFNSIDFAEMKPDAVSVGRLKAEHKPFADSRLILCTGNLYWIKGYNHMLEAMSRLRIRYPHLRLVLIGRGEDETSLKNLAEQLGLKDSVMFAGYRMNVPDWLSVADIYCQPSLVDAMPRALLEAMYMSLPVVVSDIENLKEAVKNQENGLVVKAGSPAALAEAIEYLINNMDDARRMGSNARIFVEQKCSMDVMAKRIIDEI